MIGWHQSAVLIGNIIIAAWKGSLLGVILVRIFPYSDWMRTRITTNIGTFYVVHNLGVSKLECYEPSIQTMSQWKELVALE